jgi:hypothetical protein
VVEDSFYQLWLERVVANGTWAYVAWRYAAAYQRAASERDEAVQRLRVVDPSGYDALQRMFFADAPPPDATSPSEPRADARPTTDPSSSSQGSGRPSPHESPPIDLSRAGGGLGGQSSDATPGPSSAGGDSSFVNRPLVGDVPPRVGSVPLEGGPVGDDQLSAGLGGLALSPPGREGQS